MSNDIEHRAAFNLKPNPMNNRRQRLDLYTPAELAIHTAMAEVEKLPADVRLTQAVILLQDAKNRLQDYIEGVEPKPEIK